MLRCKGKNTRKDNISFVIMKGIFIGAGAYIILSKHTENDILKKIIVILPCAYVIITLMISFIKRLGHYKEYLRFVNSDIKNVDMLEGIEFERYLRAHFIKKGYKVELTPPRKDYGVDLVISDGKERIAVQAKRYNHEKGYKVTYKAVQEVAAGKAYYKCDRGLVITNSFFTKAAVELAVCNNVILWDRNKLIEVFSFKNAPPRQQYLKEYFQKT